MFSKEKERDFPRRLKVEICADAQEFIPIKMFSNSWCRVPEWVKQFSPRCMCVFVVVIAEMAITEFQLPVVNRVLLGDLSS